MRLYMLAVLFVATPAAAQDDFGTLPKFLEPKEGALACWERTYSAAHLSQHPLQKVERMRMTLEFDEIKPNADFPDGMKTYNFELKAALRGREGTARAVGNCYTGEDDVVFCGVECDGGGVDISFAKNGKDLFVDLQAATQIRMTYSCGVDDGQEEVIHLTAEPDDKNFLLTALPASQCEPFWDASLLEEGID